MFTKWIKNAVFCGMVFFISVVLFQTASCQSAYAAEYDTSTIANVQDALNNAGYDCGTADGIEGSQTQEAIEKYQADHGLNVNSTIDDELLSSLGILDNDADESISTVGVPVATFVERYADFISDYNEVAFVYDMEYANPITEEQVLSIDVLSPDNAFEIALNYEYPEQKDNIGEFSAWGVENSDLAVAELGALIYALDISMGDMIEASNLCTDVLESLEMEYNGISYSVIAAPNFVTFTAKINDFVPEEETDVNQEAENIEEDVTTPIEDQIDELQNSEAGEAFEIARIKGEDAYGFSEGLACVKIGDKWGYIDTTGEIVIEPKYTYARSFSDGLARVSTSEGDKSGMYIDKDENVVIGSQWDSVNYTFSDGLLAVEKDDKWGYVDTNGELVIDLQFEDTYLFSEGLANIEINGKYGYINTDGEIVIQPQWDSAGSFKNGIANIIVGDKRGFIDSSGEVIIEPQFDQVAGSFSEGLAAVEINEKWGYVDTSGNWVIQPQYDYAVNFSDGLALVKDAGADYYKFIDSSGNVVFEEDPYYHNFSEGLTTSSKGIINTEGDIVIPIEEAEMTEVSDGFTIVMKDGELIIYDVSGITSKNNNDDVTNNVSSTSIDTSESEVELSENIESEEIEFIAEGNTGLFTFLSNATDNGIAITNPHNSAGDVSAEAKADDSVHPMGYIVKDQHVFEVYIYLDNNELTDSESFKSCIIGLASALNPNIDDDVLKSSIEKAIEKPDEQVIASDTLFMYSSNDCKFVIMY